MAQPSTPGPSSDRHKEFETEGMDAIGLKYLATLYRIVGEHVKEREVPDASIRVGKPETGIGEHAGLTHHDADQAIDDRLRSSLTATIMRSK